MSDTSKESDENTPEQEIESAEEEAQKTRYQLMLVDDEKDILSALRRLLKREYDVVTFEQGAQALEHLKTHHIDLIISDMRMPEMDGAAFLSQAKVVSPLAVRLILTGYADMESTIRAINEGEIYAYLSKPWNNDDIKLSISRALEFKTVSQERDALIGILEEKNKELGSMNAQLEARVAQRTEALRKSQAVLKKNLSQQKSLYRQLVTLVSDFIELRIGSHSGHSVHIAGQARLLAERLGCETKDITQIYFAALLHEVGLLALSDEIIDRRHQPQTADLFKQHPLLGAQLLEKISAFRQVAHIIRHQDENYDSTGTPDHLNSNGIPIGSRILRIVRDYDLILRDSEPGTVTPMHAKKHIERFKKALYDPEIADAFFKLLSERPKSDNVDVSYCVTTDELRPGQVVLKDVVAPNGMVMLTKETALTNNTISRLKNFEQEHQVCLSIHI